MDSEKETIEAIDELNNFNEPSNLIIKRRNRIKKYKDTDEMRQHYKDIKYQQNYYHQKAKLIECLICKSQVLDRSMKKHLASKKCNKCKEVVLDNPVNNDNIIHDEIYDLRIEINGQKQIFQKNPLH